MPQTITLLPLGDYVVGKGAFGPIALPADATELLFELARNAWLTRDGATTEDRLVARVSWQLSMDGGRTWGADSFFGCEGGVFTGRLLGRPSSMRMSLPEIGNANRVFRGELDVRSVLNTVLSVTIFP